MAVRRRVAWGLVATSLFTLPAQQLPQAAAAGAQYVSGGTAVARANGQTVADEGTVVCDNGNGVGVGGFCLPFGGGDAIQVADDALGEQVAFQVCVDNSGDGVCTSPDFGACADVVVFSHDDAGNFYNPLGPVPTGFTSGCTGGPWKGYVVLLCEGVHADSGGGHQHTASSGTGNVVTGGEGLGNFCGGSPIQQSRKPYKVGSGARYTGGGTAVARNNGDPAVDEGSMLCNGGDNVGVGGFCTSFGGGDAMAVFDDVAGTDVAFQVCIDNSGDGLCTSPDTSSICPDQVFFSHDDNGAFYNPLGPIPTGFSPGCGFGAWQGYVVFLCEGTHVATTPHAHAATSGSGRVTTGGEGLGQFCGGSHAQPSRKSYRLDAHTPPPPPTGVLTADGRCRIGTTGNELVTGGQDTFTGVVAGQFASDDPGAAVTIRCSVIVNGAEVASTPVGSGTGAASTQGQVSFARNDGDDVQACADITENGFPIRDCVPVTEQQVVPQPVLDLLEQIVQTVNDLTP